MESLPTRAGTLAAQRVIVFFCLVTLLQQGRILLADFGKHPHCKHCDNAK
jgi:hypothetical protein